MSKAFTKEDDDAPAEPARRHGVPIPDGPNYLTAAGAVALRAELASTTDADRIRELAAHLGSAEVVERPVDRDRVSFGSRVTIADDRGTRASYHIVGALEAAPRDGAISFESPLARALLGTRIGDCVTLPRGTEATIEAIDE